MSEIISILGTPGSGKSTLAIKYRDKNTGVEHISAGDRLRNISTGNVPSLYEQEIRSHRDTLKESKPLPDQLVNKIILEFINQCPVTSLVLVDGYPRFIEQHQYFLESLNSENHQYLGAIHLSISEETSEKRMSQRGSRNGEKPITADFVHWRFSEYENLIVPAINMLATFSPVITVNAEGDSDTNWIQFYQAIKSLTNPQTR